MELIKLQSQPRSKTGNGPARVLRREGRIPAVLYGRNRSPEMLSIDAKEFENALKQHRGGQVFFNLTIEKEEASLSRPTMLKELQSHPVSGSFLHADLYEIDMNRKIHVNVPLVTKGTCKGVEMGGILQIVRRELEVLCLPIEIPEVLEVDVTDLEIGGAIHLQDIPVPANVEIPADVNFTVVTVLGVRGEAAGEGEEEAGEAAAESESEEAGE